MDVISFRGALMHTLYLCYFGLREPLVQTQVLPYLRQLSLGGTQVTLLTFEPNSRKTWLSADMDDWRERLQADGIRWFWLPYHKYPSLPAKLYDILAGAWFALRLIRRDKIEVLHARSHVSGAMGALAKRLVGGRLLVDIRGFMPEEYVDAGLWPAGGYLYLITKVAERWIYATADAFVVLTDRARAVLFPGYSDSDECGRPVEVIPCCVDFDRFNVVGKESRQAIRNELGVTGRRVLVYAGGLGGWYLTDEMVEFFVTARQQDPSSFLMVLTQSHPREIIQRLEERHIEEHHYDIRRVSPERLPSYIQAADVAITFIKPCYSKQSSSPAKFAEYLAGGLPVVCNSGIGDLDQIIEEDRIGVVVTDFNRGTYRKALCDLEDMMKDGDMSSRCRNSARRRFDLREIGGRRYRRLYARLESKPSRGL